MHVSLKYPHQREHRGSCLFKKQMTNDDILTRWIARRLKTSFGFIWTVGQVGILEYLECFVQYVFRLPVRKEENHVHLHHSTWILYIESVPIQPRTLTTLVRNLNQFSRIQYRGTAPPQKKKTKTVQAGPPNLAWKRQMDNGHSSCKPTKAKPSRKRCFAIGTSAWTMLRDEEKRWSGEPLGLASFRLFSLRDAFFKRSLRKKVSWTTFHMTRQCAFDWLRHGYNMSSDLFKAAPPWRSASQQSVGSRNCATWKRGDTNDGASYLRVRSKPYWIWQLVRSSE